MFVISFRVRVFLFSSSFSEEQSAVGPREICFPFAWQAGETKPYGKNVSPYDISICFQVGGKRTGGKAENIGKAHGKCCAQTVCYYRRNCDGMESGCWHIYLSQHVD